MAIQLQGSSGTVAEVDGSTFRALRVTPRPIDYGALGFYRIGMQTGTMAVSLGANSEIFQYRWTDATRFAVAYRIAISAGPNVAATTAVLAALRATIARSWTAVGTGGTAATMTGNNQKLRTSMGTSLVNDIRIASTAALGAGTKTLDSQDVGGITFGIGTGAITVDTRLIWVELAELLNIDSSSDHPIVMAQNEGWVLRNGANAFPAGATWIGGVNTSWAEVTAY